MIVRLARSEDRENLLKAIEGLQEAERALHDTRLPGSRTFAEAYLEYIEREISANLGATYVAEVADRFAGFISCWAVQDENPAETADSNKYGYISDVYIVPEMRGRGVVLTLLEAAENHLFQTGISRVRIGSLANNRAALSAYRKAGYGEYEILFEKRIRTR